MCHFKCVTSYESYETFKIPLALLKQLVSFSLKSIKNERERDRFVVCSRHFCGFSFFWKWGHFLFRFCKYHIFAISFRTKEIVSRLLTEYFSSISFLPLPVRRSVFFFDDSYNEIGGDRRINWHGDTCSDASEL